MRNKLRKWLVLVFLLILPCWLALAGDLSQEIQELGLDKVKDVYEARQKLISLRNEGRIDQARMMELSRGMENNLRQRAFLALTSEAQIELSGSPPIVGRGVFSDIDATARSEREFQDLIRKARQNYTITSCNRFYCKIQELDAIIWKPDRDVNLMRQAASSDTILARALEKEFAQQATRSRPKPLDSVMENLTKGQEALFGRLSQGQAESELLLVEGAKDTWRSLQAAGLCQGRLKAECSRLERLKNMDIAAGDLLKEQENLRRLNAQAFSRAEELFLQELNSLGQRLEQETDPLRHKRLLQQIERLQNRIYEMRTRFQYLSDKYPQMGRIAPERSARDFLAQENRQARNIREKIKEKFKAGPETTSRTARQLNLTLEALQFAECLAEGGSSQECFKSALTGIALGELYALGIRSIAFISPTGAVLATAYLGYKGLELASIKVYQAALEAYELWKAEQEAQLREATLEERQRHNVQYFSQRLQELETVISQIIAEIEERREEFLVSEELSKYARQAQILEEAKDYKHKQGSRLETLLKELHKSFEACQEVQGLNQSLRQNPDQDTEYSRMALEDALSRASYSSEHVSEAKKILSKLQEYADDLEPNLTNILELPQAVEELNQFISAKIKEAQGRILSFRYGFPKQLLDWAGGRLEKLEHEVRQIELVDAQSWREERLMLMERYPGIESEAKGLIAYVRSLEPESEAIFTQLASCRKEEGLVLAPPATLVASGVVQKDNNQELLALINQWQRRLDCLEEGKQKFPNSWRDCNGDLVMTSRDMEIEKFRRLIRDAQARLNNQGVTTTAVPEFVRQTQGIPEKPAYSRPEDIPPGQAVPAGTPLAKPKSTKQQYSLPEDVPLEEPVPAGTPLAKPKSSRIYDEWATQEERPEERKRRGGPGLLRTE